jgi:hypothetical protein
VHVHRSLLNNKGENAFYDTTMSNREKRRLRVGQLPANLSDALDELEKDDIVKEALATTSWRTTSAPSARSGRSTSPTSTPGSRSGISGSIETRSGNAVARAGKSPPFLHPRSTCMCLYLRRYPSRHAAGRPERDGKMKN